MSVPCKTIAVLGGGCWGATLAALLSENGHRVALWEFDAAAAKSLEETRCLRVLPALRLPEAVRVSPSLAQVLRGCSMVVGVIPSHVSRAVWRSVYGTGALGAEAVIISATKGLEEHTHKRMSEVIREETRVPPDRLLVLSGPSHAEEVCRDAPTAVVLAGDREERVAPFISVFARERFRIYPHRDPLGVELCGAIKNVFAIACGIADGLGLGDNARAALMTRGLNEMARIGVALGAELLTFFGLAGMGDLIVTCQSIHSRNHALGEKIGRGASVSTALAEMTMVAEGYRTAPAAHALAVQRGLDCPLIRETYEVLHQGKDPKRSLQDLMRRETRVEWQAILDRSKGGSA